MTNVAPEMSKYILCIREAVTVLQCCFSLAQTHKLTPLQLKEEAESKQKLTHHSSLEIDLKMTFILIYHTKYKNTASLKKKKGSPTYPKSFLIGSTSSP